MRKPKLELDIESAVSDLSLKMIKEKRIAILRYCIEKKGYKNFDVEKLSQEDEDIKNYAVPVLTFRYDGELLFREFPTGKFPYMLNKRYELAV
ncbi:hypothetical protein BAZ12_00615 [Elizabethkingia miricola]|uniref:hypothetical protein n=1 Tax=Elizabethkingia TaxID=308865 RepID=UPI0008406242|nr:MULTISPECIES: hypothetical protein [Elizabethkingia]MCL1652569.1 hypothetical protein [Elizabethkingia miricola]OCW73133.1 hypothetical protein A4G24_15775 [Elizabethkingia anophelis]OPC71116.1 hypothetical protein BAZ13_09715 [Elizabethkingia miricola]OPC75577.1 hypothetical protein BAZ12_00615 [Elizabethkingia miricola]